MTVWDANKGQEVLAVKGKAGMVRSVAFSPDDRRIFAWDSQNNLLAWSTADGKPIDPADAPPAPPPGPALSHDGFLHATPQGNTVTVTDKRPPPNYNAWPLPDAAERKRHHANQAAQAEQNKQWFAAEFHLRRVLVDDPENAAVKQRLAEIANKRAEIH